MKSLNIKVELQDHLYEKFIKVLNSFNGLNIREIKENSLNEENTINEKEQLLKAFKQVKLLKDGKLKTKNAYDLLNEL